MKVVLVDVDVEVDVEEVEVVVEIIVEDVSAVESLERVVDAVDVDVMEEKMNKLFSHYNKFSKVIL